MGNYLSLVSFFARVGLATIIRALTYPIRPRTQRLRAFTRDVFFTTIRTAVHIVTIPQLRLLLPTTTQLYLNFCKKQGIKPQSIRIPYTNNAKHGKNQEKNDVQAHWLGDPSASVIILYLHGGGYTQPATEGYLLFWTRILERLNPISPSTSSKSIAVLMLAYSLAPESKHPIQLREASAALAHLTRKIAASEVSEATRSPANVILAGDSAGGGLVVSLLSHILYPHPDVIPIRLSEPLGGALLISPWVSFSTTTESMTENYKKDYMAESMLRRWSAMYIGTSLPDAEMDPGSATGDAWSDPGVNGREWWKGMHEVVKDVFVWAGGDEMLRDQIGEFVWVFGEGWESGGGEGERVKSVVSLGRAHIEPIMSVVLEAGVWGEHQRVVEEWLRRRLE